MFDEMDNTVKLVLLVVVALVVLVVAVPVLIVLAAVIASFVLGLGSEAAILVPVCGPGVARELRRRSPV